jgi:hypothetical protein
LNGRSLLFFQLGTTSTELFVGYPSPNMIFWLCTCWWADGFWFCQQFVALWTFRSVKGGWCVGPIATNGKDRFRRPIFRGAFGVNFWQFVGKLLWYPCLCGEWSSPIPLPEQCFNVPAWPWNKSMSTGHARKRKSTHETHKKICVQPISSN